MSNIPRIENQGDITLTSLQPGRCARLGKWLIETMAPKKKDSFCTFLTKIVRIALFSFAMIALAPFTCLASIGFSLYCLYKGYELSQKLIQNPLPPQTTESLLLPSQEDRTSKNDQENSNPISIQNPLLPELPSAKVNEPLVPSSQEDRTLKNEILENSGQGNSNPISIQNPPLPEPPSAKVDMLLLPPPLIGIPTKGVGNCYMGAAVMALFHMKHLFENSDSPLFQSILKSYSQKDVVAAKENLENLQSHIAQASREFNPNKWGDSVIVFRDLLRCLLESNLIDGTQLSRTTTFNCSASCSQSSPETTDPLEIFPTVFNKTNPKHSSVKNVSEAIQLLFDWVVSDKRAKCCNDCTEVKLQIPKYFMLECEETIALTPSFAVNGHRFRVIAAIQTKIGNHSMTFLPESDQTWCRYNYHQRTDFKPEAIRECRNFIIENLSYDESNPLEWTLRALS